MSTAARITSELSISLDATFIFFIVFGAFIMLVNTPMIIFIYTNQHLRKQKEVIIIGFICLADLSNATAFFFAGIHRLGLVRSGNASMKWTNFDCAHTIFAYIFIFSYQLIGVSTLSITFDRVIAVIKPFKYRSFSWRYAYSIVGGGLLYVTIGFLICLYFWLTGPILTVPAMCYTSTAYIPAIWHYMLFFRQCSIGISICLYVPISIRVLWLRRNAMKRSANSHPTGKGYNPHRRLVKTTILIGITLCCEILFVAVPDFFLNFNLFGWKKYEMIWYLIVLSKGIVNIFLYSFKHDDIKAALISKLPSCLQTQLHRMFGFVHGLHTHELHSHHTCPVRPAGSLPFSISHGGHTSHDSHSHREMSHHGHNQHHPKNEAVCHLGQQSARTSVTEFSDIIGHPHVDKAVVAPWNSP